MEDSENISGCESGWTLYLEHSHSPQNHINEEDDFICKRGSSSTQHEIEIEIEIGEDMSMVSDASSGPQHFAEEEENGGGVYSSDGKRRKTRNEEEEEKMIHNQIPMGPSFLDDTASSPFFFSFSNKTMPAKKAAVSVAEDEMIEGYSTTYTYYCCCNHKGNSSSSFQDHLGFFGPQQNQLK
ncbi:hypothetical protein R6Q59_019433 [Mikania micrantha]